MSKAVKILEKLPTGIPGVDLIADGGIPKGRTTLVAGSAGSAKTVFAAQFLAEGIRRGENGVFVTFEESARDIRVNVASLHWDIPAWERESKWAFVDASPHPDESIIAGHYDFGALMARLEHAIAKVGAKRVAIDSVGSVFAQFPNPAVVRREIFRISEMLKEIGVTTVITTERTEEYGEVSRYGVEEFVADNVVVLRNCLEEEKRRRTLEILKFRGASHQKGEFPFTVRSGEGIVVIPLSALELTQRSSTERVTSGIAELDGLCGGGFFQDSIVLVTGATGCGKTLMASQFIAGSVERNERSLLLAFEESRDQLFRNAKGWGMDFETMEREGRLKVICVYPESQGLEDHLIAIKAAVEQFKPSRVAVDSLSALERVSTLKGYREFVIALTSFIKTNEIIAVYTATTPTLLGGQSVTEAHISTITDSIILLRYVEVVGEMRRGLTVLKMRGSAHDKEIREFTIDGKGMHIGRAFRNVSGILSGFPHQVSDEVSRMADLFQQRASGV